MQYRLAQSRPSDVIEHLTLDLAEQLYNFYFSLHRCFHVTVFVNIMACRQTLFDHFPIAFSRAKSYRSKIVAVRSVSMSRSFSAMTTPFHIRCSFSPYLWLGCLPLAVDPFWPCVFPSLAAWRRISRRLAHSAISKSTQPRAYRSKAFWNEGRASPCALGWRYRSISGHDGGKSDSSTAVQARAYSYPATYGPRAVDCSQLRSSMSRNKMFSDHIPLCSHPEVWSCRTVSASAKARLTRWLRLGIRWW